jgi:hypothetical protein
MFWGVAALIPSELVYLEDHSSGSHFYSSEVAISPEAAADRKAYPRSHRPRSVE